MLYEVYKDTYNIESDEFFSGVHLSIIQFLEHVFQMRVNVYEIISLKKRQLDTDGAVAAAAVAKKSLLMDMLLLCNICI